MKKSHKPFIIRMKIITFMLFSAIWLKLASSFSVNENFTGGGRLFTHLYKISDVLILTGISFWIVRYKKCFHTYKVFFIIFLIILILNLGTSIKTDIGYISQITMSMKIFLPLLFFFFLIESAKFSPETIKLCSIITLGLVIALTTIGLLFLSHETNRNGIWSPAYFTGLHTTAYVWAGLTLMAIPLFKKPLYQATAVILSLVFINYAWGIRSAQLFLLLFFLFHFKMPQINYLLKASVLIFSIMILSLILTLIFTDHDQTMIVDSYSSGRLQMYLSKIEQLSHFSLLDYLLGKGAGSDLIFTDVWWWGKKGSHNDYFTILIEQGVIYLFLFLYFIKLIFKKFHTPHIRHVFICYLATSLVSNGIMVRPLAGYILMLSICFFAAANNTKLRSTRQKEITTFQA